MVGCAVFGCTNHSRKGFRMYGFPKDTDRRRKWLTQINSNLTITQNYNSRKLCVAHFEEEQFTRTKTGKLKLKADAVPTIFLHRPKSKRRKDPAVRTTSKPPVHVHAVASDHTYCLAIAPTELVKSSITCLTGIKYTEILSMYDCSFKLLQLHI